MEVRTASVQHALKTTTALQQQLDDMLYCSRGMLSESAHHALQTLHANHAMC